MTVLLFLKFYDNPMNSLNIINMTKYITVNTKTSFTTLLSSMKCCVIRWLNEIVQTEFLTFWLNINVGHICDKLRKNFFRKLSPNVFCLLHIIGFHPSPHSVFRRCWRLRCYSHMMCSVVETPNSAIMLRVIAGLWKYLKVFNFFSDFWGLESTWK